MTTIRKELTKDTFEKTSVIFQEENNVEIKEEEPEIIPATIFIVQDVSSPGIQYATVKIEAIDQQLQEKQNSATFLKEIDVTINDRDEETAPPVKIQLVKNIQDDDQYEQYNFNHEFTMSIIGKTPNDTYV